MKAAERIRAGASVLLAARGCCAPLVADRRSPSISRVAHPGAAAALRRAHARAALHAMPEPEHRRFAGGAGGGPAPRRREQIIAGKTDAEIRDSMVARYGNYHPVPSAVQNPLPGCGCFPSCCVLVGVVVAVRIVRQRTALVASDDSVTNPKTCAMMLTFVLIAGSLAAGAAVLLLLPLMRQRADSRPAAALAAGGCCCVAVVRRRGPVCRLQQLFLGGRLPPPIRRRRWPRDSPTPGQTARRPRRMADARPHLCVLEQYPLALRAYQRADHIANGKNVEAIIGMAEVLVQQDFEQMRGQGGRMFERALVLEPTTRKALLYGAFAAMSRGESALATERFNRCSRTSPIPRCACSSRKDWRAPHNSRPVTLAGGPAKPPRRAPGAATGDAAGSRCMSRWRRRLPARCRRGVHCSSRRATRQSPGPPFAVKRLPATISRRRRVVGRRCHAASRAASRPDSSSRSWRAWRWAERRPRPAATRSDKLAIMWARTES